MILGIVHMQILKRILYFISLFFIYIIIRELLELYFYAQSIHPIFGYSVLVAILIALIYFVFVPIYKIFTLPVNPGPASSKSHEQTLIEDRVKRFSKNKFLKKKNHSINTSADISENYHQTVKLLEKECSHIRKKYVAQLFYSSSISQNGFIDALLVLSYSVNMVKDIFILYNGRVTNRDLWNISKKIYLSIAIAGSEGIEYVTDEIITKLASDGVKSIPFIDKILGSIADGFLNALLLNRISYITENYCKLTYIESENDLYPSAAKVFNATKQITADMTIKLISVIKKISLDKTIDFALVALNPVGYVWEKTFDKLLTDKTIEDRGLFKNFIIETGKFAGNPLTYGFGKIYYMFNKNKYKPEFQSSINNDR
jgi:hypothetical protein